MEQKKQKWEPAVSLSSFWFSLPIEDHTRYKVFSVH